MIMDFFLGNMLSQFRIFEIPQKRRYSTYHQIVMFWDFLGNFRRENWQLKTLLNSKILQIVTFFLKDYRKEFGGSPFFSR